MAEDDGKRSEALDVLVNVVLIQGRGGLGERGLADCHAVSSKADLHFCLVLRPKCVLKATQNCPIRRHRSVGPSCAIERLISLKVAVIEIRRHRSVRSIVCNRATHLAQSCSNRTHLETSVGTGMAHHLFTSSSIRIRIRIFPPLNRRGKR